MGLVILLVGISDAKPKFIQKLTIFQRTTRNLDLVGFALFTTACIMLIMPLQWGGAAYPWVSAEVTLPLIASFMTFSIFIAWQHTKGDAALIRFSLLKRREVWSSCLVTLFSRGAMFVHVYYLPLWFQLVQQSSPIMSGIDNLPSFISQIVVSIVCGRLGQFFRAVSQWKPLTRCSFQIRVLHPDVNCWLGHKCTRRWSYDNLHA